MAYSEMLKVPNSQGQAALPAHGHQEGTCQALNLRTNPGATHLNIHLGKEDPLAPQKVRDLGSAQGEVGLQWQ